MSMLWGNILNMHLKNVFVLKKIEVGDSNKYTTFLGNISSAFSKMQEAMEEESPLVNGQAAL